MNSPSNPAGSRSSTARIAALQPSSRREHPRRRHRVHAAPRAGRLPHPPAVRGLARRGVRAEGHRRPVRGDRARRRRDRVLRPSAARNPRRDCARPGPGACRRDAARRHDDVRVQVRLRPLDAPASSARSTRDRARGHRLAEHDPDRATRPRRPQRLHGQHLDGRGRADASRGARARERARHLRRVDRVRARRPRPHGAVRHEERRPPPRACRAVHDDAVRPGGAEAQRPLGRPPVNDPPRRHPTTKQLRDSRGAAPRRRVHGRRADRAGARPDRRRRDHGARHRRQPGHLADLLAAADHRPRRPPLRTEHDARRSSPPRSTRPTSWTFNTKSGRSSSTSAPTWCCSTARPSTSPTAWAATRSRRRSSAGEPAYVRPDAAWRIMER